MREIVVTEQMNGSESKGQWDDTSEWIKIHEDEQNYSTGDSQLQPSVAIRWQVASFPFILNKEVVKKKGKKQYKQTV